MILFHACLKTGLNKVTRCLNSEVAVSVAATDTNAVVAAVTRISPLGTGTSRSVPGMSNVCTCGGWGMGEVTGLGGSCFSVALPLLIPGGGLRSLGGTTRGL